MKQPKTLEIVKLLEDKGYSVTRMFNCWEEVDGQYYQRVDLTLYKPELPATKDVPKKKPLSKPGDGFA